MSFERSCRLVGKAVEHNIYMGGGGGVGSSARILRNYEIGMNNSHFKTPNFYKLKF